MLSCRPQQSPASLHRLQDRRHPPPPPLALHLSSTTYTRPHVFSISSSSIPHRHRSQSVQNSDAAITTSSNEDGILRTHNAKSTALVMRQLSSKQGALTEPPTPSKNHQAAFPEEDRVKLLEMSLVRKRTPQFPGSIYVQSPGDADVNASLPPIQRLFDGEEKDVDDDDEMLMRALEIRRKVTAEILKEAMRKGRFSINYSNNLASRLSDFIDYIMIQAASMKKNPEFSHSSFNVRAKIFIDDSNVVPLIRWLKHNELSYPYIAKLICMSRGNLKSIKRIADWLKSVHVRGRYIGVALTKSGGNILERSTEELEEIVDYLESNGVRGEWMGYVISRCPNLLSFGMEELETRVKFYRDMGMNENDLGTMIFDCPKVLGYFSMEEMEQKVAYLKEFGLEDEDVGRLLAFKPQLMVCSIEERWKPLVKYFYYLGISRDGMRRILTVKPMVFCIDLEKNIATKVQFLRDIGVQEDAIGPMLAKFPQLLTYSLHKKIRPVVIFLLTKAGVTEQDIGKVIASGPELLGCNIANKLDPSVKYFLSLGISLRVLGQMISDFPLLLRYNVDVLCPKYKYLRRTMVRPLKDAIEFPRFFSYSLDGRIIPRHKILVENRINFKLRYMLRDTDDEFQRRVEAAVERRRRFESGITDETPSSAENYDYSSHSNEGLHTGSQSDCLIDVGSLVVADPLIS